MRLELIKAKKKRKESSFPENGGNQKTKEDGLEVMSQKEINRRKLAEARKRDAEKYGEPYVSDRC